MIATTFHNRHLPFPQGQSPYNTLLPLPATTLQQRHSQFLVRLAQSFSYVGNGDSSPSGQ